MKGYKNKKAVAFIIVLSFVLMSSYPLVSAIDYKKSFKTKTPNQDVWEQTINFSEPKFTEKNNFLSIEIDNLDLYTQVSNQPIIPYKSLVKTFPLGTKINEITCTYSEPKTFFLDKPIITAPDINWYSSQNTPSNTFIFTQDEKTIPWCSYHLGGGIEHGEHVTFLSVHVFPVNYNQNGGILKYIDEITIKVFYEPKNKQPSSQDNYSFLIIAPSEFQSILQKLESHKTGNGINTKLITLDDIYNNVYFSVEGYDDAEKIKYFIKESFEQWGVENFLLVGSIYKLPMRKAWFGDQPLLTDLYYADLYFDNATFCSWDSNGNHVYGEYFHDDNKDILDLYPDVYLGRLACSNSQEARILVNKIIKYESKSHDDWWNKIILLGGDTFPGFGVFEGEVTNQCIADALPGFNHVKLWTSEQTYSPKNINSEVNKGARFMEYSGHGYQFGMGTSPPNEEKRIQYYTYELFKIFNGYKLPVIFFDACLTAKLDFCLGELFSSTNILKIPFPVYAWYWVKKIGGGAIATIGATEVAYSTVDAEGPQAGAGVLSLNFFKGYQSCETVSEMLVYSQNYYLNNLWRDHWTIEQFILLGDPTLKVGGSNE